ncbi:nucleotidyltransferase domain-containing protein [Flavobacterium columnare]|nr:nucleotidyltransferase domain-containing protein [Flavobacterium columnare]
MVPNRHGSSTAYRYGFQGQEKDDELKGEGNWLNYTFRMHDSRVGRFFATDPLEKQYPNLSPYQFSANSPIAFIEREGLESTFYVLAFATKNGYSYFHLQKAYEVGQGMETITGRKIKLDLPEKNYVQGSDGHWHEIPDNIMNQSTMNLGGSLDEIYAVYNKGRIADKEANMAGALKVMEELGNRFQVVMSVAMLFTAVKDLSKIKVPQGVTKKAFKVLSDKIRVKVGSISDDVVIQGSRANGTAKATSDIDIAIKVDGKKFDELVKKFFGTPNAGSAKEKTMLHAIETGKIQAGEAKLSGLRKEMQEFLGMDVDISIIKTGGKFDNGAQIPISK